MTEPEPGFREIALMVLFLALLALIIYWVTPERTRYAFEYNTASENVFISPKPHDCDFFAAPIGSKNCRYIKHVEAAKWQPDRNGGQNRSDPFGSIHGEKMEETNTKVYVTWEKESDD
jgi:hypothetical protein